MKKYLYIALAALGMMGCESDELYPDGDGVGTLVISGIEVETVVGDIQTKASMEESDIPVAADFTIVAINTETQRETTLEIGINELEAGSYIVRATYGEEKGMSYTPYFSGEKEVTLTNGETRPVSLRPSLQNAILRPKLDETLINQYNNYALNIQKDDDESITLTNDKDFYLPVGTEGTYTLTLFGENKLGIMVSHDWTYQGSQFVAKTRYIVNCNPDLPSFTLPAQAETNAWSKFIYVTPMTEEDFSYIPDGMTTEEILANVVYEASTDGQTWIPAITDGEKIVIKDLQASTSYTVRATYGGVNSDNTATLVTESAQQIRDGNMDTWEDDVKVANAYGGQSFYNYFVGSQDDHIWETNNEEGLNGATTHATNNIGTYWRWCAGTQNTTDVSTLLNGVDSQYAAEISTLGFYTEKITGWYAGTIDSDEIIPDWLGYKNQNRICLGLLYVDKTQLSSRPSNISFDYKYEPVTGDAAPVEMALYDADFNELWCASMDLNTQLEYVTKKVIIDHSVLDLKKVALVTIRFQSGTNTDYRLMHVVEGDYNNSPRVKDRVVGSVLKIDNVVLNYDYE